MWKKIGAWLLKAIGKAAAERLAEGLQPKPEPKP
jgi:hypothetical protein